MAHKRSLSFGALGRLVLFFHHGVNSNHSRGEHKRQQLPTVISRARADRRCQGDCTAQGVSRLSRKIGCSCCFSSSRAGGPKLAVWRMPFPITGRSSFSAHLQLWMEETCCASIDSYLSVYRNAPIGKLAPNCAACFGRSITRYSRSRSETAFISKARAHTSATIPF